MARQIPEGIKEPFSQLPAGTLEFEVESLGEIILGEKYCLEAKMKVVGPPAYEGQDHTENFFIGTDEDPNADLAETWMKRAGRAKQFVEKCGVQFEGQDLDVVCSEIQQRRVLGIVKQSLEPEMKKGQPNPYAGRVRSNVRGWLAVGEREPQVEETQLTSDPQPATRPSTNGGKHPAPATATRPLTAPAARPLSPPAARVAAPAPRKVGR